MKSYENCEKKYTASHNHIHRFSYYITTGSTQNFGAPGKDFVVSCFCLLYFDAGRLPPKPVNFIYFDKHKSYKSLLINMFTLVKSRQDTFRMSHESLQPLPLADNSGLKSVETTMSPQQPMEK